jgi:alcohol dehydrogenase (NADP+)
VIRRIAGAHGVHPAAVCLKWAVQRGQVPIPFSTTPRNLAAVCGDPLSDREMAGIAEGDRRNRLIKGQVFLWEESQDWRDLWDEDGVIAPAPRPPVPAG